MRFANLRDVEAYLATMPMRSDGYEKRLAHASAVLARLGQPQDAIPAIHIAGTSGKGSTAYYAAALLHAAGYSVGLVVSPHVSKVSERAQVNGAPLPDEVYCRYFEEFVTILENLNETLTYVEFVDIFAYWLFAQLSLDYIVIEVGLGGRLDPTNVMTRPDKVCVITDIGFDHMELLGLTLSAIATEKAGIIHEGNQVCMHRQPEEVMRVIEARARQCHAPLVIVAASSEALSGILKGYQRRNWLLAHEAVTTRLKLDARSPLTDDQRLRSTAQVIPGRFEVFSSETETIILDAAHNPQKIKALVESLQEAGITDAVGVVSFGDNKAATIPDSMAELVPVLSELVATEFNLADGWAHGAFPAHKLAELAGEVACIVKPHYSEAFTYARVVAKQRKKAVIVTGSFFLISNLREEIMKEFQTTQRT